MTDQTEREAFEKWCAEQKPFRLDTSRKGDDYEYPTPSFAWEVWQASWRQARASLQGRERVCKCADHVSNSVVPPRSKDCFEFLSYPGNSYCLRCGHHVACHARKEG